MIKKEIHDLVDKFMEGRLDKRIKFSQFLDIIGKETDSSRYYIADKYFNPSSKKYLGLGTIGEREGRQILVSDALKYDLNQSKEHRDINIESLYNIYYFTNIIEP